MENYASIGLRTLVLVKRNISESEYKSWQEKYHAAQTSMQDREKKMEAVQELIEKDLELIAATAIEDKLQDEVGPTIANLKKAGIKVWVLTGDKIETAINIGYSCQLLSDDLIQIIIDGSKKEEVDKALDEGVEKIKDGIVGDYALVISGSALIHGMETEVMSDKVE